MTKDKQQTSLSRRHFLKMSAGVPLIGLGAPPALSLFSGILDGLCQKAWAQSNGVTPRNTVLLTRAGAPSTFFGPHQFLDLPGGTFNPHMMVRTNFATVNGRYVGGEYNTLSMNGMKVPFCWGFELPTPGGGYAPASQLLSSLLCIQGINTRNAGHDGSGALHMLPTGAKQSMSAIAADPASKAFAAVNLGAAYFQFRSLAGKSAVAANPSGGITTLMNNFTPFGDATFRAGKASFKAAFNTLLPALDVLAKDQNQAAQIIIENRDSAIKLAETNFTQLNTQWTALLAKYNDLVTRAMYDPSRPVVGLNDKPIGEGTATVDPLLYELDTSNPQGLGGMADYRNIVGPSTTVTNLAANFAIIEYLLVNGLTTSVSANIGGVSGLRDANGTTRLSVGNDQHTMGAYAQLLVNSLRYRAEQACLLELVTRLQAAGIYNDTIIWMAGEFARNVRSVTGGTAALGTDHGSDGQSHALYCGAFKGPFVVGNLAATDGVGHWGRCGNIPSLKRPLWLNDTAVTLCHLAGVPPVLTAESPIVTLTSNGLVSNIGPSMYV